MKIMPDEERKEALDLLAQNKQDIENQLHGLPLIIETQSLINTKARWVELCINAERRECHVNRIKIAVAAARPLV